MASQQQQKRANAIQSVISTVNNASNAIAHNMSSVQPNGGMFNNFVGRSLPVQQVEIDIG